MSARPPAPPPTPAAAFSPRRLLTGRLGTAIATGALLVVGLAAGEVAFTVVVAAIAGAAAVDLSRRLDPAQPPPPGVEEEAGWAGQAVSAPAVAAAAVIVCLAAGLRLDGVLSHFLGLALAVLVVGGWGMTRAGTPGLVGALGRSAVVVFICGFGAAHAVVMRKQEYGLKLAWFLVVAVAFYEAAATIFEAGTVQLRPGNNRPAPVAGSFLCVLVGLVASQVANPPIGWDDGAVLGLSIALAAAAGRAVPALFAPDQRDRGIEIGAVAATLFVAAPVGYYVGRVVL